MEQKNRLLMFTFHLKRDNVNVHRAAAKIIVSKSRAARGSVCNVLLSRDSRCGGFSDNDNRLLADQDCDESWDICKVNLSVLITVGFDF